MTTVDLQRLAHNYEELPRDSDPQTQARLDIDDKTRRSLFPWRGQFSPQLIAHFLDEYSSGGSRIYDPFCGSGTVISEAITRGLPVVGFDINPAAYLFSCMHGISVLGSDQRTFLMNEACEKLGADEGDIFKATLELRGWPLLIGTVGLMLSGGDSGRIDAAKIAGAMKGIRGIIAAMPTASALVEVAARDSRFSDLAPESVDLLITSPPYINVFNYHQNFRATLEGLGWTPLKVATSEIGANRKFRQNRFKTVVQYSIDMAMSLNENRRVLSGSGKMVFVVGRCSSVRRISFPNSMILGLLATTIFDMKIESWKERKFLNRFGEIIYEDILVFSGGSSVTTDMAISGGRLVGEWALEQGLLVAEAETYTEIIDALRSVGEILPSAKTVVPIPPAYESVVGGLSRRIG